MNFHFPWVGGSASAWKGSVILALWQTSLRIGYFTWGAVLLQWDSDLTSSSYTATFLRSSPSYCVSHPPPTVGEGHGALVTFAFPGQG